MTREKEEKKRKKRGRGEIREKRVERRVNGEKRD